MGVYGTSILVVDFNSAYVSELRSTLKSQNIQIFCCESAEQAEEILRQSAIELVVVGPLIPAQTVKLLNTIRNTVPEPTVIFSTNITSIIVPHNQYERISSKQISQVIESRLNERVSVHTFSGHKNEHLKPEISSISSPIVTLKNELHKLQQCLPESKNSDLALEEAKQCAKSISQISKSLRWLQLQQTASTLEMALTSFLRQPVLKGPEAWALVDASMSRLQITFAALIEKYKATQGHPRKLLHSDLPPAPRFPTALVISKRSEFCERIITLGKKSQIAIHTSNIEDAFKHLNILTFDAVFIDQVQSQICSILRSLNDNSENFKNGPTIFTVTETESPNPLAFPQLGEISNMTQEALAENNTFSEVMNGCQRRKHTEVQKILLLQNDNQVTQYLTDITQHYGMEIHNIQDPLSLLDQAEQIQPDLCIMDISSRSFDANDLCKMIRTNSLLKSTPVLFLGQPESRLTKNLCDQFQNTDFINKPIFEQEFIARMWVLANQHMRAYSIRPTLIPRVSNEAQDALKSQGFLNNPSSQNGSHFDQLLLQMGIEIQSVGSNGTFKQVTPLFAKSLGHSPIDLEGKTFLSFVHPDDQQKTTSAMATIREQKKPVDLEIRFRSKQGSFVWFSWRGVFTQNCFYAMAQNITEKKQMHLGLEQLFYMSPFMICMLEQSGHFSKINPSFMTVLGYTQGELVGKELKHFLHAEDIGFFESLFQQLRESKSTTSFQNRFRKSDGTYCWLYWKASFLAETNTLYAMAKDITEAKTKITIPPHLENSANLQESLHAIRDSLTQILKTPKTPLTHSIHNLVQNALHKSEHLSGSLEQESNEEDSPEQKAQSEKNLLEKAFSEKEGSPLKILRSA